MESNNKLIAEFMELPTEVFKPSGIINYYHKEYNSGTWYEAHELSYNVSWDWLMPVAEKCLTSDEKTDGQHYFINDALLTCNIDVVYDRVVEFIKDYNQNN
tara:strand:- start:1677 stop:1979 length:303 start_codon:yes stop_codon:yes gene_type:complete